MTNVFSQILEVNNKDYNVVEKVKKTSKNKVNKSTEFNNNIKKTIGFDYNTYFKKGFVLSKFKIPELKEIAKYNNLKVGGNKLALIQRLENYFKKERKVSKIQSVFRRYLVLKSFHIRGPAYKQRSLCVNDSDFYTLEPLNEIDNFLFFSYKDAKGFIYGFDISSLVSYFNSNIKNRLNPYNRELFDVKTILNIVNLNRINKILFQRDKDCNSVNNTIIINGINSNSFSIISIRREHILRRISLIRQKNMNTRIQDIFIEIDMLGNYTNSSWFTSLSDIQCVSYIRRFKEFWIHMIPVDMKMKITPLYNPLVKDLELTNFTRQTDSILKNTLLTLFENIIYGTDDIEYQKIGVLHILTILTLVSIEARNSLPWLYESIVL